MNKDRSPVGRALRPLLLTVALMVSALLAILREEGVWLDVWRAFLDTLEEAGRLRWDECFADGSFAPAKKGGRRRQDQERQGHEVDGGGRW